MSEDTPDVDPYDAGFSDSNPYDPNEDTFIDDQSAPSDLFMVNYQTLHQIMSELKDQNIKRTHQNVIDKFATKNVSSELAEAIISIALERNLITSYQYAKLINYKTVSATETAIICYPVGDASKSTEQTKKKQQLSYATH